MTDTFLADLRDHFSRFITYLESNPDELETFKAGEWCVFVGGPGVTVDLPDATDMAAVI